MSKKPTKKKAAPKTQKAKSLKDIKKLALEQTGLVHLTKPNYDVPVLHRLPEDEEK